MHTWFGDFSFALTITKTTTQFQHTNIKTMILPYLGLYWSVWPHLLLDICLFVSCVSINVLEMPGERLVFAGFWRFCTFICARAPKTMIRPYLGLYWSIWPHLLLDICLFVSCVSINVLEMPGEWLVFALFWRVCTGIYVCCTILMYLYSMQQSYKRSSVVPPLHYRVGTGSMKMLMSGLLKQTNDIGSFIVIQQSAK